MLERAAEAAYREMVQSMGMTDAEPLCAWSEQPEQLREDWRRAVLAALRVYGVSIPRTSRVVIDSGFVSEIPTDYKTITIYPVLTK